ncbi:Hypothetical predicted protein [Octopus vulgaris]|uniref:Uncharacterized protein n=1 Tax=Octopus vulgaris TaxID=6645 RepID=A0AA36F215_OCTVU|nr:Hypothetical predicted protein [Octopus vulgaris]
MLAKDFYNVISDGTKAVAFLRRNGLLDDEENAAPCHCCGGEVKEKTLGKFSRFIFVQKTIIDIFYEEKALNFVAEKAGFSQSLGSVSKHHSVDILRFYDQCVEKGATPSRWMTRES